MLTGLALCTHLARAELEVHVRTVDEDVGAARLERFSLDQGLVVRPHSGQELLRVPAADVIHLHSRRQRQAHPKRYCLELAGGDRLYGQLSGGGEDHVVLDTAIQSSISIPLEYIRVCLTPAAAEAKWKKAVARLRAAAASAGDEDGVLLSNGDVLHGFINRLGPDGIEFEQGRREFSIDLAVVVAAALSSETPPQAGQRQAFVRFVDGSALTVSRMAWSCESLDLTYFDGTLQNLPPDSISSVEIRGGRWQWLSELEPQLSEHTPARSLNWPPRRDRDVAGGPLVIGRRQYTRGIGVHSQTVLHFNLQGQYERFMCAAGMDDSAGRFADVSASISVDGETKWSKTHCTAGAEAEQVRVTVRGATVLELRVDFGENGDIQDRFNWADALLVRP